MASVLNACAAINIGRAVRSTIPKVPRLSAAFHFRRSNPRDGEGVACSPKYIQPDRIHHESDRGQRYDQRNHSASPTACAIGYALPLFNKKAE